MSFSSKIWKLIKVVYIVDVFLYQLTEGRCVSFLLATLVLII